MTLKRRNAQIKNFTQYRLNGMIGGLHAIYYERRKEDPELLSKIGLCVDVLTDLKNKFREYDYE